MVINSSRSRATATHGRTDYHFCSTNCQEVFVRNPERYVAVALSRPGFPSEPPPPRH